MTPAEHTFAEWCTQRTADRDPHTLVLMAHAVATRAQALAKLKAAIPKHYVDPIVSAGWLRRLGAARTAAIFEEFLPIERKARAGDLGEILATEYAETRMKFQVPVYRLRWKDGRNMALRGDDLVAYVVEGNGLLVLKGEVKARRHVSDSVLDGVKKKLKADRGRPNRHTIIYLVTRLHETEQHATAELLEDTLITTAKKARFKHLVFTLSKNAPREVLERALTGFRRRPQTVLVGMHVADYDEFINQVFESLNA